MAERKTARQKIEVDKEARVVQVRRKGGGAAAFEAVLVPSPRDVEGIVRQIPAGQRLSVSEVRSRLASRFGAEKACPMCVGIFLRLVAEAAEEDRSVRGEDITPWWRVVQDNGSFNPKWPGGGSLQKQLLAVES